jgi:hypothetical protein
VQWGVIPGTVDGNRQWGFSREDIEAVSEFETWQPLLHEAYAEFNRRMNPAHHNWVTMTWLWL